MGAPDESTDLVAAAFGARVTEERERLGLSKEALATRADVTPQYLWRVEAGKHSAKLGSVLRIAAALGITAAALITGIEELVATPRPRREVKPRGLKAARLKRSQD